VFGSRPGRHDRGQRSDAPQRRTAPRKLRHVYLLWHGLGRHHLGADSHGRVPQREVHREEAQLSHGTHADRRAEGAAAGDLAPSPQRCITKSRRSTKSTKPLIKRIFVFFVLSSLRDESSACESLCDVKSAIAPAATISAAAYQ